MISVRMAAWCILALAVAALLGAAADAPPQEAHEETMRERIKGLQSKDARARDRAVDAVLEDHKRMVKALIPLIDPANADRYSDETRCAAAYLLGQLRAVEAVPVLSKALADPPGPWLITDSSRFDAPVWHALVRIGRPAVPAMIRNIETSDHRMLRIRSLGVLNHVLGGKRRLLELLDRLKKRAGDDKQKAARIEKAAERVRSHYKEDEEPLY